MEKLLGENVKERRKLLGMTQKELSEKTKLSRVFILQIEKGGRPSPSVYSAYSIAKALNTSIEMLLGEEPREQKYVHVLVSDLIEFLKKY